MVELNSETLFNGAAAAVATVAALMFIVNVQFPYSPATKIALVLVFLAGIFLITQRTSDYQLTVLGYGVIVASGLALFFEVIGLFSAGTTPTVFGLLVIAGLLFALRTRLDEDSRFVSARQARYLLAAVAVFAALVLVVDVVSGGLVYELQPESEVEIAGQQEYRGESRIGSLVVSNPTPLPERVETPRYEACAAGNWSAYDPPSPEGEPEREASLHANVQSGYDEHVLPFGAERYPITVYVNGANVEGESFRIETTEECPDDGSGTPYIALFEVPEDRSYAYAV
ncbi:hypothetical protein [Halorarum halobium]|uniref:hypothetical protein n=1 Tax=Halorarum halobium TaxID=3075121 RepID=UPI0028AFB926|nr:hypothetical protein [Halobaculum sp. XH14]